MSVSRRERCTAATAGGAGRRAVPHGLGAREGNYSPRFCWDTRSFSTASAVVNLSAAQKPGDSQRITGKSDGSVMVRTTRGRIAAAAAASLAAG